MAGASNRTNGAHNQAKRAQLLPSFSWATKGVPSVRPNASFDMSLDELVADD